MTRRPGFADRLVEAVDAKRSQVCLGLDPDPSIFEPGGPPGDARERAAAAVASWGERLIEAAAPYCVAVKPQLARYEVLGAPGWAALERTVAAGRDAGLLVIADGKRGDIPVTAEAYGRAMLGATETPWGRVPGLGADALTANPLLGRDALEPIVDTAVEVGAGVIALVRTSNPGAADLLDLPAPRNPLHERIAEIVVELGERLVGEAGLSGMGAVVGAPEPRFIGRLRELMPQAVFLLPGVGAQGGSAGALGAARGPHPASTIVAASRSLAGAADPAAAAERLRDETWAVLAG